MTREERRKAMPITTEIVDAFRDEFGELDAIKAEENGVSVEWEREKKEAA